MEGVIYPELSYKIIACAFAIYNQLGSGYAEKYYERALRLEFDKQKINYKEQLPVKLTYDGQMIGKYIVDFVVDDKILVELKRTNQIYPSHQKQVLNYLQTLDLKLGLLIYFTNSSVKYSRIINFHLQ
ncbi:MAG: GxxExxY protein [Patescibacteria group bacterium]